MPKSSCMLWTYHRWSTHYRNVPGTSTGYGTTFWQDPGPDGSEATITLGNFLQQLITITAKITLQFCFLEVQLPVQGTCQGFCFCLVWFVGFLFLFLFFAVTLITFFAYHIFRGNAPNFLLIKEMMMGKGSGLSGKQEG